MGMASPVHQSSSLDPAVAVSLGAPSLGGTKIALLICLNLSLKAVLGNALVDRASSENVVLELEGEEFEEGGS